MNTPSLETLGTLMLVLDRTMKISTTFPNHRTGFWLRFRAWIWIWIRFWSSSRRRRRLAANPSEPLSVLTYLDFVAQKRLLVLGHRNRFRV